MADQSLIDRELMAATRLAMQVSSMGRAARSRAGVKVRQPLAEVKVWGNAAHLNQVQSQILEELNIKQLTVLENFEGEAPGLLRPGQGRGAYSQVPTANLAATVSSRWTTTGSLSNPAAWLP